MDDISQQAPAWVAALENAIRTRDNDLFQSLFAETAMWRDLMAFTLSIRQFHDRAAMGELIWAVADELEPSQFSVDENFGVDPISPVPFAPEGTYEINFTFQTTAGSCDALVNVVPDPSSPVGFVGVLLLTRLTGLAGLDPVWPKFGRYSQEELESEHKTRAARAEYEQHDPDVLIVGGGHNGVMAAAELSRLGLDALVVDRYERNGDSWRNRYESLVLHMPHGMMHFPRLPFPESFPDYISKDRLADWYDVYVTALDLNVWLSTEFISGEFDEASQTWTAVVRREDGTERTLHPKYLILATGAAGTPRIPDFPGLSDFAGEIVHSSQFKSGRDYSGKKVLVVGVGTSAHDIAFDVSNKGGSATMMQRSPTFVVDLPSANLNYGAFNTRDVPTEVLDKRWLSTQIKPMMLNNFKAVTTMGNQLDAQLHQDLEASGMVLDKSEFGWFAKYFEVGGGYYINVGASRAIVDGDIAIMQADDLGHFVENGLVLKNGELLQFDAIVMATGWTNQKVLLERLLGAEVAERIGDVGSYNADGDPERHQYKAIAGQPRLAICGSGICAGRWYAPLVALRIQAELEGRIPEAWQVPGHITQIPDHQLVTTP